MFTLWDLSLYLERIFHPSTLLLEMFTLDSVHEDWLQNTFMYDTANEVHADTRTNQVL